jgi:hypothetical protein
MGGWRVHEPVQSLNGHPYNVPRAISWKVGLRDGLAGRHCPESYMKTEATIEPGLKRRAFLVGVE